MVLLITIIVKISKEMMLAEVRNNEVRRRITILPQEVDSLAKQIESQGQSIDLVLAISYSIIRKSITCRNWKAQQVVNRIKNQPAKNGADFGKLPPLILPIHKHFLMVVIWDGHQLMSYRQSLLNSC